MHLIIQKTWTTFIAKYTFPKQITEEKFLSGPMGKHIERLLKTYHLKSGGGGAGGGAVGP